jgi:putative SOS response-associated peptidase YedK
MERHTNENKYLFYQIYNQKQMLMAEIHNIKNRYLIILKPEDEANWLRAMSISEFALQYTYTK